MLFSISVLRNQHPVELPWSCSRLEPSDPGLAFLVVEWSKPSLDHVLWAKIQARTQGPIVPAIPTPDEAAPCGLAPGHGMG